MILTGKYIFCFLVCCCITQAPFAQKKFTISGYIRDKESTENLISATVYNPSTQSGTSSNNFGFYSLTLSPGSLSLVFSYVGYSSETVHLTLSKDTTINIELQSGTMLDETVISSRRPGQLQEQTQMSSVNIPISRMKILPMFLGEVDLMKVLQLMPGIQSGGEGSTGLYVRGGGPDQNLILLDGVPVYNASHLFGFFSVFNADAINNMELLKGGFPARYGGRTSSVVDIRMKEGNNKEFHGEGSIGLISAKLTLEGPIWKDKTSFIISGRRTYADLFTQPIIDKVNEGSDNKVNSSYYFYDLTAKINHRFSNQDRLFISAYMGDDNFYLKDHYTSPYSSSRYESISGLKWGNITSAIRWNHVFTNQLFGNTTLTYSRFRFNTTHSYDEWYDYSGYDYSSYYRMDYSSSIKDLSAKLAFDYLPTPSHHIRFGTSGTRHLFEPGVTSFSETSNDVDTVMGASKVYAGEWDAYIEDDYEVNDRLKLNVGLHWSGFAVQNNFYNYLQPRISGRYLLDKSLALKVSYSRMAQYVQLLTNSGVSLPTDLWVPTTDRLKPQTSNQWAAGISKNINNNYELSVETYYKTMKNALEYREGASYFDLDGNWENKVLQGEGESYGIELYAEKKTGKLTGWVGYTLSRANRTFDLLNNGKTFPYKYDRRHDFSFVSIYQPKKNIEMSVTWVFGTGNAITIPTATFNAQNPYVPIPTDFEGKAYGDRNAYRMSAYHRMDLSVSFIKKQKWGESRWAFGIYNMYCRRNPYYIDVEMIASIDPYTGEVERKSTFTQYSLFPIIPSISYHFKF